MSKVIFNIYYKLKYYLKVILDKIGRGFIWVAGKL